MGWQRWGGQLFGLGPPIAWWVGKDGGEQLFGLGPPITWWVGKDAQWGAFKQQKSVSPAHHGFGSCCVQDGGGVVGGDGLRL